MQPGVRTWTQDLWTWGDISPKERAETERRKGQEWPGARHSLVERTSERDWEERGEEGDQEPWHPMFPVSSQLGHFTH